LSRKEILTPWANEYEDLRRIAAGKKMHGKILYDDVLRSFKEKNT